MRKYLPETSAGRISIIMKRLKPHGIKKKVNGACRHYLAKMGREVAVPAIKLKKFAIIPSLNYGGGSSAKTAQRPKYFAAH